MRAARLECCLARDMLVLLRSTTPPTLRARRLQVVGARSDPSSYQPMTLPPTQVGGRRPRTGCLKRTGTVKSCERERPQDLTKRFWAEPALHRATLGRAPPAACAYQPVEGRASSVSCALVSTKRSRCFRSHAMSMARSRRFAPATAPTIAVMRAKSPSVALNPSHAPTRAPPAAAASPVALL